MLVVGGAQVPVDDLELLLNSGIEPREAWINPAGGHMGRTAGTAGPGDLTQDISAMTGAQAQPEGALIQKGSRKAPRAPAMRCGG